MNVPIVALVASSAVFVSVLFAWLVLPRIQFHGGSRVADLDALLDRVGELDSLDGLVSDVVSEVTRRLDTQDSQIRTLRDEWESAHKRMRSTEARINRKRQMLEKDEGDEDGGEQIDLGDWDGNGAPAGPPPMTLEQRVWQLRHGGKR